MGQSQLTMQEVQLKIKIIKKVKNPATVCFLLKGSSGGVELNKNRNKTVIYLSTSTASPHSLTGSSASGTSPGQPTGANHGTHRPGPVAVTGSVLRGRDWYKTLQALTVKAKHAAEHIQYLIKMLSLHS